MYVAQLRALGRVAANLAIVALALITACGPGNNSSTASSSSSPGSPEASSPSPKSNVTLTVYTGQHAALIKALADAYTAQSGVKFDIRNGSDGDLVNQIIEEGSRSSADLFLSEEPGPVGLLDGRGLLAPIDKATIAEVAANLVPSSGNWVPYAARSRVIYYNPKLISEAELPNSILDLTKPEWKGKFAYAPSGAFVSTVSYLINTIGEDQTLAWLKGIKENGINEGSNGKVRDTVEAGQHPFGLSNHYYWWQLAQTKGGPDKLTSKIHYIDHPDAGSLVMASGAAILKSSSHQAEAQAFVKWLASASGGEAIVGGNDAAKYGAQYPVAPGVKSQVGLPQLSDLKPPKVDQNVFSATDKAKGLLTQSGIS